MPVKEVILSPAGVTGLDFGQNFAGYVTFKNHLPKGTKITFDHREILQDGNFYNENYRAAKSQFVYISDGSEELVRPSFTYFGFRNVRVTGWPGEVKAEDMEYQLLTESNLYVNEKVAENLGITVEDDLKNSAVETYDSIIEN